MEVESWITTIAVILGILVSCGTLLSYYKVRKKELRDEGGHETWLRTDITYVKNSIDDLRLDVKEFNRKQNEMSEKIARLEERVNSIETKLK